MQIRCSFSTRRLLVAVLGVTRRDHRGARRRPIAVPRPCRRRDDVGDAGGPRPVDAGRVARRGDSPRAVHAHRSAAARSHDQHVRRPGGVHHRQRRHAHRPRLGRVRLTDQRDRHLLVHGRHRPFRRRQRMGLVQPHLRRRRQFQRGVQGARSKAPADRPNPAASQALRHAGFTSGVRGRPSLRPVAAGRGRPRSSVRGARKGGARGGVIARRRLRARQRQLCQRERRRVGKAHQQAWAADHRLELAHRRRGIAAPQVRQAPEIAGPQHRIGARLVRPAPARAARGHLRTCPARWRSRARTTGCATRLTIRSRGCRSATRSIRRPAATASPQMARAVATPLTNHF